jgi:hypothetical protein
LPAAEGLLTEVFTAIDRCLLGGMLLQRRAELRQVSVDDLADRGDISTEVLVHEDVSEAADLGPLNLRVGASKPQ